MPRTSEPVRRIETPAGVRYVAVADAPHARGEKRRQVRRRFARRGDAVKWLGQMRAGTAPELQEPEPEPEVLTFASIARPWLEVKRRTVRAVTFAGYEKAVKIWTTELGDKPLDQISKADIEALVNRYQDEKRSYSRVSYLLAVCRSILGEAVEEELVGRNVAARVKPRGASAKARQAMSAEEIRKVRIQASKDPWEALWVLSLLGLRRSEVLGLRWSDIDFEAGTLSVRRARVQIGGSRQINVTEPKTANGGPCRCRRIWSQRSSGSVPCRCRSSVSRRSGTDTSAWTRPGSRSALRSTPTSGGSCSGRRRSEPSRCTRRGTPR